MTKYRPTDRVMVATGPPDHPELLAGTVGYPWTGPGLFGGSHWVVVLDRPALDDQNTAGIFVPGQMRRIIGEGCLPRPE